jgi:hypothetical protein
MTELTRRTLLTASVAATAVAVIPPSTSAPVRAAAPPAGTQAPGWYRYKVGSFEITAVTDGVNRFKLPDNMVTNVPREEVNAALVAAHREPDVYVTPYNPIVVNTGQKLVVIDTGLGEAAFNASKGANGQVLVQSRRGWHRLQKYRCRDHLALPRRPRERSIEGGQLPRLSQRRDSGAGGGT